MALSRVIPVMCATALVFGLAACSGGSQTQEEACLVIEESNAAAEEASVELMSEEIGEDSKAVEAISATMDVFLERSDEVTEPETKALLTDFADGVDTLYETLGDLTVVELQEDTEVFEAYGEQLDATSKSLEALYSHCGIETGAETAAE